MMRRDDMPRRDFFSRIAGVGAVAALGVASPLGMRAARAAGRARASRAADATGRTFAPFVGDRFQAVAADGRGMALDLVSVDEPAWVARRIARDYRFRRPYSLLFRDPKGGASTDGIYRLKHRTLGVLDLFLVTSGSPQGAALYEATFG